MIDLAAAVDAGARAWFARVQAGRMDPGRLKDDGTPIGWDDIGPFDQLAYRELALPIVVAALATVEEGQQP